MSSVPFESQRGWLRQVRARAIEVFEKTPEGGYPKERSFYLTALAQAMREEYTTFKRETGVYIGNPQIQGNFLAKDVLYLRDLSRHEIEELSNDDQTCHICYEDFLSGATLNSAMQLECGHMFCERCIAKWFCSSDSPNASCPMCRAQLCILECQKPLARHQWRNLPQDVRRSIWAIRDILKTTGRPDAFELSLPGVANLVAMKASSDNQCRYSHLSEITVSAAALLEYLSGKWTRLMEEKTLGFSSHPDGALRLEIQIRVLQRRLQTKLKAMEIKTLWDTRSFGLMDLVYPARLPLVKDFVEQLLEAEQYQQRMFNWLRQRLHRRPQGMESPHRYQRPQNEASSLAVLRAMPLDREHELHSSISIADVFPNRFDNEAGVVNEEARGFTSDSPRMYELDAPEYEERYGEGEEGEDDEEGEEEEEERSGSMSQLQTTSSGAYILAATDVHELNMARASLMTETELHIEDDAGEARSSVSERPVDAGTDLLEMSMSNAVSFLLNLDHVSLEDIEEDARQCPICTDDYLRGGEREAPVRLECGHVFGRTCLERWLSPYELQPKRSCPMCRAVLFEEDQHPVEDAYSHRRGFRAILEEPIPEETIDESEEGSEFIDFLEVIASTTATMDFEDRMRAMGLPQAFVTARAEGVLARQYRLSFSSITLSVLRHFIASSAMNSLERREVAFAIRPQMGRLFVRLQHAMREREMPIVWREDGPPLSFLLDPAAQPLLESALERMIEIEEAWIWGETRQEM